MFHVQTVSGPIAPDALGHSQIHEHIFVHRTPMAEKNPALRLDDPARSLEELRAYRAAGGGFLADAQPVAAGRDAERLGALSRESGVAVAASTGYHLLGFYPADCWVHSLDEEGLYDLYCGELLEGMLPWRPEPDRRPAQPTAFRAGLVKAAIPAEGAEGRYAVLLRAAARAAVRCGVPLMLHTERGENTLPALELCFRAGLTPERLIVCHVDRQAADFGPHDAIAATGVYLDYDTIGRFKYHSDEEEVALLRHMCERGYTQRLLLSLDTTAQRMAAYGGGISLCYLLERFLPRLEAAGFPPRNPCGFHRAQLPAALRRLTGISIPNQSRKDAPDHDQTPRTRQTAHHVLCGRHHRTVLHHENVPHLGQGAGAGRGDQGHRPAHPRPRRGLPGGGAVLPG